MAPPPRDEHHGRSGLPASQTVGAAVAQQPQRDEQQALLLLDDDDDDDDAASPSHAPFAHGARRRSSVSNRLAAVADLGGVNSFRSFARSWHRAASFAEVLPRRPSLVVNPSCNDLAGDAAVQYFPHLSPGPAPPPHTSLLGQHLERSPWSACGTPGEPSTPRVARDRLVDKPPPDTEMAVGALPVASPSARSAVFAAPPHLATPDVIGSYGSFRSQRYGTVPSRPSRCYPARRDGGPDVPGGAPDDDDVDDDVDDDDDALGEHQPILVKEVKQGDKMVLTVEGQSTLPQSTFNSINALIGVGLLSLPLALRISGWLIGLLLLTLMALVATHTAKLLGRCMETDPSLITYSDLAYVSFGARARVVVSVLFTLELIGACVALIILFADSLDLLLPGLASVNVWKCICAVLVLALNTLPLRLLSYTSVVGIFSTVAIVCIVVADGLVKQRAPGSLWEPAATHLLPSNWLALPLAYGLLASPWGAHCVFPSIYRDMRHPAKWKTGVNVSFSCSYALDTCLAIVGILMFGDGIKDMVTSNVLDTPGFPKAPTILMCVFIAIIPLTKIPLNSRPLITTADVVLGLHRDRPAAAARPSALVGACLRALSRVLVVAVLLLISVLFPAFDSVCAFLGAALCSIISIILPISFYLKLHWRHISLRERAISWLLLALFSVLGLVGTAWSVLPKHLLTSH